MRLRSPTWARNGVCVSVSGRTVPDILRRVDLVTTLLSVEVLAVTVCFMREPTVCSRTALGRVVRSNLLRHDTALRRFVLSVLIRVLDAVRRVLSARGGATDPHGRTECSGVNSS